MDEKPIPNSTIKIGASASFGTALNITRYGSKIFANVFDHQNDNPNTAPPNVPARKPPIVDIDVK